MGISNAEYLQMQARLHRAAPPSCNEPTKGSEAGLHGDIMQECKRRGWIYFHGAMSQATARTVGEPDFTILADKGRVFFMEVKTKIGKLSIDQRALAMLASHLGHTVHVVRSIGDFFTLVDT